MFRAFPRLPGRQAAQLSELVEPSFSPTVPAGHAMQVVLSLAPAKHYYLDQAVLFGVQNGVPLFVWIQSSMSATLQVKHGQVLEFEERRDMKVRTYF